MIRINLLAVERGPVKRAALIPAAHRVTIAAGLVLLLTVLGIGGWFWSLRRTSQQVDDDITRAATPDYRALLGKLCKECGNSAVIRKDGCEFCTACGAIGACG